MASQSKTHVFLLPALIDDIKSSLAGYLALPELGYSQRPQQESTASKAMSQSGHSYIFLTYSQRPQQVSTASKDMSQSGHSYIFLICGQRPLQAFGRSSSLGPLLNTHGFTKLNLCLSFTSVDRRYPKKHKSQKDKS
jgi:hypothetical protein